MTVNDIVEYLKTGEIRQLKIKDDLPTLLPLINLALLELHKTFDLRYNEIIIDTTNDVSVYDLPSDLIKISNVYDENGIELPLNKEDEEYSVYTPSPVTIQIPKHADDYSVSVVYVANHPKVTSSESIIYLSPVYLDALLLYIAYKGYVGYGAKIDGPNNTFYMRYVASIKVIRMTGIHAYDEVPTPDKIEEGGWV